MSHQVLRSSEERIICPLTFIERGYLQLVVVLYNAPKQEVHLMHSKLATECMLYTVTNGEKYREKMK